MAIFGIGAYHNADVTDDFLRQNIACIGWSRNDAPALYKMINHVKVGDLLYIKSNTPQAGLTIKAVGIVLSDKLQPAPSGDFDGCILVEWLWSGSDRVGRVDDKFNVRNNTLYEEYNNHIQRHIVEKVIEATEDDDTT